MSSCNIEGQNSIIVATNALHSVQHLKVLLISGNCISADRLCVTTNQPVMMTMIIRPRQNSLMVGRQKRYYESILFRIYLSLRAKPEARQRRRA